MHEISGETGKNQAKAGIADHKVDFILRGHKMPWKCISNFRLMKKKAA
jgi:hypothetical protein